MRIIAIVGMPGSGKTETLKLIEKQGIPSFNMGDVVTKIEPRKRGITKINEYIEDEIRMDLRKKFGPAAVAIVTAEEVEKMHAETVAISGLHSFAELNYFKEKLGGDFTLISIEASPELRAKRSAKRNIRPLAKEEFEHREHEYAKNFEIPKIMQKADYKISNEGSIDQFRKDIKTIINEILRGE
jgi:dephospho-CoA kinase